MKIAYVSRGPVSDVHAWSGSIAYILRSLQAAGLELEVIDALGESALWSRISNLRKRFNTLTGKRYHVDRDSGFLGHQARQVDRRLVKIGCDAVFSPGSAMMGYTRTKTPFVFWADATFAGLLGFYPGFDRLSRATLRDGHRAEQAALSKCRLAIYASDWAARTAIQQYEVDPGKVKVVPFGANVECTRDESDIRRVAEARLNESCCLLFVGVDWRRKGGERAFEVAEMLNNRGLQTELHVVGCPLPRQMPKFVKHHGFISKQTSEGRERLRGLFERANFLIVPSHAECYGLVYAEASSFGVPSLATNVGGISSVVRDGVNGWTLPLEAGAAAYCDYIERLVASPDEYFELALSCFREYSERLNWSVAGKRVAKLLEDYCR